MSRLSKFKEHKVFIELDFMDKVLNSVEEYLWVVDVLNKKGAPGSFEEIVY